MQRMRQSTICRFTSSSRSCAFSGPLGVALPASDKASWNSTARLSQSLHSRSSRSWAGVAACVVPEFESRKPLQVAWIQSSEASSSLENCRFSSVCLSLAVLRRIWRFAQAFVRTRLPRSTNWNTAAAIAKALSGSMASLGEARKEQSRREKEMG